MAVKVLKVVGLFVLGYMCLIAFGAFYLYVEDAWQERVELEHIRKGQRRHG